MGEKKMIDDALALLKAKLGISLDKRDMILKATLLSVMDELENVQGITLEIKREDHLLFLVDYAAFLYEGEEERPRHLNYRLHNLMIRKGGGENVQ